MKKALALILALVMVFAMIPAAFAVDEAETESYDYELKYLYDTHFWYAQDPTVENPTLGYVINFLSTNTRGTDSHGENFPYQVDLDKFINSALGEKTAELWNIHMQYPTEEQMSEGLLNYWAGVGLKKEAFYANDEIATDYYVYTPTKVEAPEAGYPLIIMNHGGGEKAYQTETFGFCEIAAREGIILAAAESTGNAQVKAVMDKVIADYPVDESRVYIVGSSMGGNAARNFAMANVDILAGAGIMDQPVGLASRWGAHSDEQLANLAEYKLPMVWVGGTADMYGLHGTWGPDSTGAITNEFFEKNEGGEPFAVTGWNVLMDVYGIEGKNIESRLQFVDDPDANYAEYNDGYPFDNVVNIDTTGTAPRYRCTLDGTEYAILYLVENRAHMPSGFDAEDIWSSLKVYSRDPETKELIKIPEITAAETYTANAPVADGDVTAQITTADGTPAFKDEEGVATAADGVVTIDASKITGINFNGTTDLYIGNTKIATYVIPELTVDSQLFGSVFTNGKSTLKYSYDQKVDYGEDSKATLTLNLDGLDDALIDSTNAKVILDEGDGYFPEEYTFLATEIGEFENGEATYALKQGDLEMDVQGYLTVDKNSGREWSCLGGDGHGNYWYNLTVDGITYNGLPVGSQTFRLHIYVYGYDYTSDANNLYTAEGTKITPVKSETGSGVQQGSEVVWTHDDTPILCDWVQDDIFVTWPTGSDKSGITAEDVTITLKGEYGDTKVLEAGKDYTVYASAGETQIALSYINWPFIPVYTTMTVDVAGESETMDIASVYVYEAQQGGGGVTVDGTVTVYSFYGLKDVTPIANFVTYTLSANVDSATKYYAEDESGNGILVDTAAEAKSFDGNGVADCNVQVIENSIYVTTRRTAQYEDKTVDGETITFTKTYTRGGMKNPSQTNTDLLETLPGYVIPYGTSNWITNEKWAWQEGVNEGWLAMHFVNEGNRASYPVTAGTTTQLELQNEVEGVKYMIVGHPTSDETTVTEDGLLTIGPDESGFCGVMAYVEGDPYAQATVTFSIKAPANTVVAGSTEAKSGEGETATIPVTYNNEAPASSVRLKIGTELPIKSIDSKYSYEFNPSSNYVVVYTTEEFSKGDELFTITFDLADVDDGTYKVKLNVVDATDADAETLDLIGIPGYVVINNWTDNGDGTATNGKTGETVIIGEDGIPGTDDDNKIVNPAGTVIKEDVEVQTDEDGNHYVDLGNGFILTAGEDGKLGTTDDVVTFGEYQQSADPEVGKEPIEWYVLAIDGDMATLVTKDVIDGLKFNLELEDGNDWANSNYRNWLNSYEGGVSNSGDTVGFYNTAFSDADKDKILPSKVNMSSDSQFVAYNRLLSENWWQYYSTNTGNDTIDYVYALSGEEVFEYFGLSRIATLEELGHAPELYTNGYTGATEYAQSVGVKINTGGNGPSYVGYADSWTRSPGEENCGVFLGSVGSLNSGREVTRSYGARPVVTVELKSYLPGDVNRDGEVSNVDLILVARYLVDLEDFDSQQLKIADFNSDGVVNNSDLILIARYIVSA
jgi:hypothetical protein